MIGAFLMFENGRRDACVPGKRGVPAGGAGEHPEILLDGEDHYSRRRGVPL